MLLTSEKKNRVEFEEIIERIDFIDIIVLKKFYFTEKGFPNDMEVYCLPVLVKELKNVHNINLTKDAIRKRLLKLVKIGLLEKVKNSNPSIYLPIEEKKEFVEKLIKTFIIRSGLQNLFFHHTKNSYNTDH